MATDQEVIDAKKQVNDNVTLEEAIVILDAIQGAGGIQIVLRVGENNFNLNDLIVALTANTGNQQTALDAIQSDVAALIGVDDVTLNTIRKALRDLVNLNDIDIAAT